MKKIITFLFAGVLLLTAFAFSASAQEQEAHPNRHRFLAPIEPIPDYILEKNIVRINNDNIWNIDWFIHGALCPDGGYKLAGQGVDTDRKMA